MPAGHECRVTLNDDTEAQSCTIAHHSILLHSDVSVERHGARVAVLRVLDAGTGRQVYYPFSSIKHWDIL